MKFSICLFNVVCFTFLDNPHSKTVYIQVNVIICSSVLVDTHPTASSPKILCLMVERVSTYGVSWMVNCASQMMLSCPCLKVLAAAVCLSRLLFCFKWVEGLTEQCAVRSGQRLNTPLKAREQEGRTCKIFLRPLDSSKNRKRWEEDNEKWKWPKSTPLIDLKNE